MKIERLGEENYNNFGTLMKIVEYKNAKDIIVEFQDEHKIKIHTRYGDFKRGKIKNPYDKSVYGVGYVGEGKYKSRVNGKITEAYNNLVIHGRKELDITSEDIISIINKPPGEYISNIYDDIEKSITLVRYK